MENNLDTPEWPNQVYYRWVFLPVLACLLSLVAGLGALLLCPILLTVAHYLTLRQCAAVLRPGLWFITLPVTWFFWYWAFSTYNQANFPLNFAGKYYLGQFVNALLIPLMTKKRSSSTAFSSNPAGDELTLRWMLALILAAGTWTGLYYLSITFFNKMVASEHLSVREFWQGASYFAISLIANAISGLVLKGMERED